MTPKYEIRWTNHALQRLAERSGNPNATGDWVLSMISTPAQNMIRAGANRYKIFSQKLELILDGQGSIVTVLKM